MRVVSKQIEVGLYGARSGGKVLLRLAKEIYQYLKAHESFKAVLLDTATEAPSLDCVGLVY